MPPDPGLATSANTILAAILARRLNSIADQNSAMNPVLKQDQQQQRS